MYLLDCATILGFLVLTWSVLVFVLREASNLSSSVVVKIIMEVSAGLAGVFATAALVAVLVHLKKNRESLYREDLSHLTHSKKE